MLLVVFFTVVTLAAHVVEITLWALSFVLCGEFSNFTARVSTAIIFAVIHRLIEAKFGLEREQLPGPA